MHTYIVLYINKNRSVKKIGKYKQVRNRRARVRQDEI